MHSSKPNHRVMFFLRTGFIIFCCFLSRLVSADEMTNSEIFVPQTWNFHFQTTLLPQYHGSFPAAYSGKLSLNPGSELATSFTATGFLGVKVWAGGIVYYDPEIPAGTGLSGVSGIADFSNGEISKVGSVNPTYNTARLYAQQVFGLGGEQEKVDDDQNQLRVSEDIFRLTVIAGKFSLPDFFDNNAYAHDARTQFINLALVDNLAWDYAADTHGYTLGVYAELNQKDWAVRFAEALMSTVANGPDYDWNISQAHADNLEVEWRYGGDNGGGKIRLLGYINHADMGNYQASLNLSPVDPDITQTRIYTQKYGLGLGWEQTFNADWGLFGRLGWNDGATESFELTAVDETASLGTVLKGTGWGRADDQVGLGFVISGLSSVHQAYLAAGGYDFIIGDGALSYAPEQLFELYYLYKPIKSIGLTLDFQGIENPAYNQVRGPVGIVSGRAHFEI
jgi:high affinity Mn2+ porin